MKKTFLKSVLPTNVVILISAAGEESSDNKLVPPKKSKISKDLEHIDIVRMHAEIGLPKEDIVFAFSRTDGPPEAESKKHLPWISATVARHPLGNRCIQLLEHLKDHPDLIKQTSRKGGPSLHEAYCDIIRHVARGVYSSEKYIVEKLNGQKHRKLVSLLYGSSIRQSLTKEMVLQDLTHQRKIFNEWIAKENQQASQ